MIYPEPLQQLISYYKKLPGIGEKGAERMALSTLKYSDEEVANFSQALLKAKSELVACKVCGHLTDKEICDICSDKKRDHSLICVIEDYKSVFAFEQAGNYNGTYHVLGALISPMENISPDDINISGLVKRVKELKKPELILALKSSIEGETTTLYIKKIFENTDVTISRLSYGIPIGAEIDYLDLMTLDRALEDRKKISEE